MATYYVAKSGNDRLNDGSRDAPWRTIQYGIDRLSPGDTLYVRDGVYSEVVTITTNNVTVAAQEGHTPIIDGGWNGDYIDDYENPASLPGSLFRAMVQISSNDAKFRGFVVQQSNGRGIQCTGTRCSISDCQITVTATQAIAMNDSDSCVLDSCEIFNCGRAANYIWGSNSPLRAHPSIVTMRAATDLMMSQCVVRESYGEGIMIESESCNIVVDNCVSYDNWANQCYVHRTQNTTVRNCLFYCTEAMALGERGRRFGIVITDETEREGEQRQKACSLYNNLVVNCSIGILARSTAKATPNLESFYIGFNTIVDCELNWAIFESAPEAQDTIIENNISLVTQSYASHGTAIRQRGITWRNNLWSSDPENSTLSGLNPIYGDPQLLDVDVTVKPDLNPDDYCLANNSPAIQAGFESGTVERELSTERVVLHHQTSVSASIVKITRNQHSHAQYCDDTWQ